MGLKGTIHKKSQRWNNFTSPTVICHSFFSKNLSWYLATTEPSWSCAFKCILSANARQLSHLNAPGFTQHLLVSSSGVALTQRARRPAKEKEVKKAMLESVGGIKTVWESNNAALVCFNICSPWQHHHHGVDVDGTVGHSLQHKLFVCKNDKTQYTSNWLLYFLHVHLPMIFLPCLISSSSTTAPNCSMAFTVWK